MLALLDNVFLVLSILNNSLASVLHWPFSKTSELWVFSHFFCAMCTSFQGRLFQEFKLASIWLFSVIHCPHTGYSWKPPFFCVLNVFDDSFPLALLKDQQTVSVSTFSLCSIILTIALQFVSTGPFQRPTNCECFHVFPVLYNFNNSLAIRFHLPFSKTSEHWVLNFLETVMGQKPSHDLRLIQTWLPRLLILLHDIRPP